MSRKDEARLNKEIDFPRTEGTCRYCGAIMPIIGADKIDADNKASEGCDCGGYEKEQRLKRATQEIRKMFGSDCTKIGLRAVNEKGIDVLIGLAKAINEGQISTVGLNIDGAKAVMSLTAKGKIRIVRTDQRQCSSEA